MNQDKPENIEAVLRRVQKLLAIAEDSRADANEAGAAAAMAEKIMRKYQLEHSDVMAAEFKRKENFSTADVNCAMKRNQGHQPSSVPMWGQWLAVRVANLYECQATVHYDYLSSGRAAKIRFSGYKADVQMCSWTYEYLLDVTIRAVRQYQKEFPRDKVQSNAYRVGFVTAICANLRLAAEAKDAEVKAEKTSNALVVAKASAVQQFFGKVNYGSTETKDYRHERDFHQGRSDGSKVDVNRRGIGSNTSGSALLLK